MNLHEMRRVFVSPIGGLVVLVSLYLSVGCATTRLQGDIRLLTRERDIALKKVEQEARWRQEKEKDLERIRREMVSLEDTLAAYKTKLNSAEITNILELQAKLDASSRERTKEQGQFRAYAQKLEDENIRDELRFRELLRETEQKSLYRGRLDVWESLSIKAYPTEDKGIIFSDYHYVIELRLNDKTFFSCKVETKEKENPIAAAFDKLDTAAWVASVLSKAL